MKLFYCDYCKDVVKMTEEWSACRCGKSMGRYINDNDAEISGDRCVPIGISNYSLRNCASYYLFGECPSHATLPNVGWLLDAFVYTPNNPIVTHRR